MSNPSNPNGRQTELVDRFGGPAWTPANASDASLAAATKVHRSGRAASVRLAVLRWIAVTPSTDHDLCRALTAPENTIRPRRRDLVLQGLVEATDQRRRTPSGSMATVWAVTEKGRAVLRGEEASTRGAGTDG